MRQHLSTGGVCDPATGKWHDMSDVCYLVTANHTSHSAMLTQQLLKEFVVLQWDEYRYVAGTSRRNKNLHNSTVTQ